MYKRMLNKQVVSSMIKTRQTRAGQRVEEVAI